MKIQLSSLSFLSICPLLAGIPDVAGPISGDVSENQVTLWMYAPLKSKCTYIYHAEGVSETDQTGGDWQGLGSKKSKQGKQKGRRVPVRSSLGLV